MNHIPKHYLLLEGIIIIIIIVGLSFFKYLNIIPLIFSFISLVISYSNYKHTKIKDTFEQSKYISCWISLIKEYDKESDNSLSLNKCSILNNSQNPIYDVFIFITLNNDKTLKGSKKCIYIGRVLPGKSIYNISNGGSGAGQYPIACIVFKDQYKNYWIKTEHGLLTKITKHKYDNLKIKCFGYLEPLGYSIPDYYFEQ